MPPLDASGIDVEAMGVHEEAFYVIIINWEDGSVHAVVYAALVVGCGL